jgi:thiamine-phosphate pyrophosphorylase
VTDLEPHCRLYAVIEAGDGARDLLAAALQAADLASVLIAAPSGTALRADEARALVELAQKAGAAALVAGDATLAHELRADGVHLAALKDSVGAYAAARAVLGARAIVGVDPGLSRHDAMSLAEAGADYVAFGAPAHLKDRDKARIRRDDLVAWWGEIFEVPCVAFDVETPPEAAGLARAGADFVAVRLEPGSPSLAAERLAAIAEALRMLEAA